MSMKAVGWLESGEMHWLGDRRPEDKVTLYVEVPEPPEDREPIGYRLEPIYAPRRGQIVTQAFRLCASCRGTISSTGGPGYNSLCLRCVEKLDVFNRLTKV